MSRLNELKGIGIKLLICMSLSLLSSVHAQNYPSKPIKFYLPNAAGGVGDLIVRLVSQKVSERLGQQIVVENRPSAAGIQAFSTVLKSPADGYSLALIGNGASISHTLVKNLPFDVKTDFEPVAAMAKFAVVVLVKQGSRFHSIQEVIEHGRKFPGQLNLGTINVGSTQYLGAEMFKQQAQIKAQIIPFNSSAAVLTALRSGDIDLAFEFIGPVYSFIESGNIKALGVAAKDRLVKLPKVPTVSESGLPGFEVSSWNGVFVRSGTPKAIIAKLEKEYLDALSAPDIKQSIENLNADILALNKGQTQELLLSDIQKWRDVIHSAHIELSP
jgi:tripartite-type tricarboxylate transporter receptor subunit TctC